MRTSTRNRAIQTFVELVSKELASIRSVQDKFGKNEATAVSRALVGHLIKNESFFDCLVPLTPHKQDEWLTTEKAARMSGFSRPFIAALLDGPSFKGRVTRTEKGHRRVRKADFVQWMTAHSSDKTSSMTLAKLRSTAVIEEPAPSAESAAQKRKRTASKKKAFEAARRLGIA